MSEQDLSLLKRIKLLNLKDIKTKIFNNKSTNICLIKEKNDFDIGKIKCKKVKILPKFNSNILNKIKARKSRADIKMNINFSFKPSDATFRSTSTANSTKREFLKRDKSTLNDRAKIGRKALNSDEMFDNDMIRSYIQDLFSSFNKKKIIRKTYSENHIYIDKNYSKYNIDNRPNMVKIIENNDKIIEEIRSNIWKYERLLD